MIFHHFLVWFEFSLTPPLRPSGLPLGDDPVFTVNRNPYQYPYSSQTHRIRKVINQQLQIVFRALLKQNADVNGVQNCSKCCILKVWMSKSRKCAQKLCLKAM